MMDKLIKFLQESKAEMDKVKWPTKDQTIAYTKNVIVLSLIVAAFLGSLDYFFNSLIGKIL